MGSAEKQRHEKKKQRERFFLDRFLEHQGLSPTCIQQPEPPDPDALIDLEGRRVGIELTEIFVRSGRKRSKTHPQSRGEPLPQAVETITDQIASTAREFYLDEGNPPALATIVFSSRAQELDGLLTSPHSTSRIGSTRRLQRSTGTITIQRKFGF